MNFKCTLTGKTFESRYIKFLGYRAYCPYCVPYSKVTLDLPKVARSLKNASIAMPKVAACINTWDGMSPMARSEFLSRLSSRGGVWH